MKQGALLIMAFSLFLCLLGFFLLSYSADKLVEGAANLAEKIGVSHMVIGLTVVAFGTSLPEMVISVNASLKGNPEIAVGNAVGSNIMNAALILGIAALIQPITCKKELIRREVPIMIGVAMLTWYMAYTDSIISFNEGVVLLILFFVYNILSYKWAQNSTTSDDNDEDESAEHTDSMAWNIFLIVAGLIGLILGGEALVRGATDIARSIGVSDEVIALTLIAIGTSLPELATAIVASRKGHSDLTLGNVVGSNIFNILGIIGLAAVVCSFNAPPKASILGISTNMLGIHIPLMVVVSLGVLPIMSTGLKIIRAEGAFLVLVYVAYNFILFQTSPGIAQNLLNKDKKQKVVASQTVNIGSNTQTLTASGSAAIAPSRKNELASSTNKTPK